MNMKFKKTAVFLFCAFLIVMMLLILFLPAEEFSVNEKRYLASAPELSAESVFSGEFGKETEDYVADHMPFRNVLLNISANYDHLFGRQTLKDIYIGEEGRLFERPSEISESDLKKRMEAVNLFAQTVDSDVSLMLIPSAGYVQEDTISGPADSYSDDKIIEAAYGLACSNIQTIDLIPSFSAYPSPGELFYRTDHHWTSRGAYLAAGEFLSVRGKSVSPEECYSIETVPGFFGTTYSRSMLWQFKPDTLEIWDAGLDFTVNISDSEGSFDGVFFRSRLDEADKYPVFLDGNHPLIRIGNDSPEAEGSLLIIRDSYSSCLAPFLAEQYKTVVLVDLRYYRSSVSELVLSESFDDVAIIYSIGNFTTDSNLLLLE